MYVIFGADGKAYGPVDVRTICQWVDEGRVIPSTVLLEVSTNRQFLAQDVPALSIAFTHRYPAALGVAVPGQVHTGMIRPGLNPIPKNKVTAIILTVLLGGFGVHRFYLGHHATGALMLVLTLLTPVTFCLSFVAVSIWTTVDLIALVADRMPDSDGVIPM